MVKPGSRDTYGVKARFTHRVDKLLSNYGIAPACFAVVAVSGGVKGVSEVPAYGYRLAERYRVYRGGQLLSVGKCGIAGLLNQSVQIIQGGARVCS